MFTTHPTFTRTYIPMHNHRLCYTAVAFLALAFGRSLPADAQTQKGQDLIGAANFDNFGYSVSMPDAVTLAVGGTQYQMNPAAPGYVRVYRWNGSAWLQKGSTIIGEGPEDKSGYSMSMPDSNTIAIGGITATGAVPYAGHVRIYTYLGGDWIQKGADIDGAGSFDNFGASVSMPDANTVAVGAPLFAHSVQVFAWNGSAWVQKGASIDGVGSSDVTGKSVSMPDANTLAIGAPGNDAGQVNGGRVQVYRWDGVAWTQKGTDILGQIEGENSGYSVTMPDSNTIGIGAPNNSGGGLLNGHARIFTWNGMAWMQKGLTIDGPPGDATGWSVSMPDAHTITVGAPLFSGTSGNDTAVGCMRTYAWAAGSWVQSGATIYGNILQGKAGMSVSMPDVATVAFGAPFFPDNSLHPGYARVYQRSEAYVSRSNAAQAFSWYPNPAGSEVTIDGLKAYPDATVVVSNVLGQAMSSQAFHQASRFQVSLPPQSGVYYVAVHAGGEVAVMSVIRE